MRLVHTIFAVVAIAFVLPVVILGLTAHRAMTDVDAQAGRAVEEALQDSGRARLLELTSERVRQISSFLGALQRDVEGLRDVYAHLHRLPPGAFPDTAPLYPDADRAGLPGYGYVHPEYGAYADFERLGVGCPWVPRHVLARMREEPTLRAKIALDLHRLVSATPFLRSLGARYGSAVDLAWIVLLDGPTNVHPPYAYHALIANDPGLPDVDESKEDYVRLLDPHHNPDRRTLWLAPYLDRFSGVWMTSVVAPLYDGDTFLGTVGLDVLLGTITAVVHSVNAGKDAYAFLVTSEGRLIAIPGDALRDLALAPAHEAALRRALEPPDAAAWSAEDRAALGRDTLADSGDEGVRVLAAAMQAGESGARELRLSNEQKLVTFAPISEVGWSLAVVAPLAGVLAPADDIRATIGAGTRTLIAQFVILFAVIVVVSTLVAFLLHYLAIRPLGRFTEAVAALRWDDLELRLPAPRRRDEIGRLYAKFRDLIGLIRDARDDLTRQRGALEESNQRLSASNQDLAREVRERMAAQGALAQEKELLAVTLRSVGDGLVATDAGGRVTMLNPVAEQLTGWTDGEARGRPLADVMPLVNEETGAPRENPVTRVLATGRVVGLANHTALVARDGTRRAIADSGAPILDVQGAVAGVILVFRDVTDARRVEEELARVQKLETVRVLAAGIAHDFNNLLSAILGYVALAREGLGDVTAAARLARAEKAIERARELTLQLLTFSTGGEPVREATSLAELLREAAGFALHGVGTDHEVTIEEGLWPVHVDAGQIAQVVQNLALNAHQAMPSGGLVRVHARNVAVLAGGARPLRPGRYVEVCVADSGAGVSKELRDRIFDPFFTTKPRGSGLGLAVCFSILRRHGGHIELDPDAGHGATFRFWLPAADGAVARARVDVGGTRRGSGRVLVMDDEEDVRDVSREMLVRLGYEVEVACDGEEAIRTYRQRRSEGRCFAAVILDLTVRGGMGGKDALAELRRDDPTIRAIVSTGYSNDPVLAAPEQFGFCGTIRKPFDLRTLGRVVQAVLAGTPSPGADA